RGQCKLVCTLPSRDRGRQSQPMEQRGQCKLVCTLPSRDRGRQSQKVGEVNVFYDKRFFSCKMFGGLRKKL
ncbi:MAG: hypothetical protein IJR71_02030, partial [Prevotella sp.]|nr:hypothetical protein [Prevotella sp.]